MAKRRVFLATFTASHLLFLGPAHATHNSTGEQIIVSPGVYMSFGAGTGGRVFSVGLELSAMVYPDPWWNLSNGAFGKGAVLQLGWSALLYPRDGSRTPDENSRDFAVRSFRPSAQWFRIGLAAQATVPRMILFGGSAGLAYEIPLTNTADHTFSLEVNPYITFGFESVGARLILPLHSSIRGPQIAVDGSVKVPFSVKGLSPYAVSIGSGRPLWIAGQRRIATANAPRPGVRTRVDRVRSSEPSAQGRSRVRSDCLSARRSARWSREAVAEHASVPAFAHLARDLMAHGAPLDLVRRAHQAGRDEIGHALLCAREVGGSGPNWPFGSLATLDRGRVDLRLLLVETLLDGCLGEAEAVREARRRLKKTASARTKAVLLTILRDEARHRDLAFDVLEHFCRKDLSLVPMLFDTVALAELLGTTGASRSSIAHVRNQLTRFARSA